MDLLDRSVTEALRAWRVQHSAGVEIGRALQTSATVCSFAEGKRCFEEAARQVDSGKGIDGVLIALRPILSDGERAVIAAGWISGRIDAMMDAIVQQREIWLQARTKIRAGMVLPALLLIMACFVGPFVGFITGHLGIPGFLFASLTPLAVAFTAWKTTENLLEKRPPFVDALLLRLPIVSGVEKSRSLSEFASQLSLMLNAGVVITQALETCSRTITNRIYGEDIQRCLKVVKQGVPLSTPLPKRTDLWPPEFIAIVATGEKSGTLDDALKRAGNQSRDEYSRSIAALAAWLPRIIYAMVALFMIVQIATIVGIIAGFYRQ